MMDIVIRIDEEKLLRNVMENFPEASFCLRCTSWNYDGCEFAFHDDEEDKLHIVTLPKLQEGLKIMCKLMIDGKLPGLAEEPPAQHHR